MSDEIPPSAAPLSHSDEHPPPSVDTVPTKDIDPSSPVPVGEETVSNSTQQPPPSVAEKEVGKPIVSLASPAVSATTRETASETELPPPVAGAEKEPEKETPAGKETPAAAAETKAEVSITESEKGKSVSGSLNKTFIQPAVSFKEESNLILDLSESQLKSLFEFRKLLQESIDSKTLLPQSLPSTSTPQSQDPNASTIESALKQDESPIENPEVTIYGIPLFKDNRTENVLLKFLRARDFKVNESFQMIKNTLKWRQELGIDNLVDEKLGDDLDKVVFMHGQDRNGHPVCYNVYGEFQNKDLYAKTFGDEAKRERFLRWRIQFLEKSIRKLDFAPGGVNTIFQINDLKNAPGPGKKELRQATRQALLILQDNYPEFVAKQVFINVPWWYVAFYTMMSPFMTQRTKSKFVFSGPSKTADTLFKYISPERVPIQYGGLSMDYCDCNPCFSDDDPATEIFVKPTTKQFVEILCSEKCVIVWELRVVGWEVTYGAEFVPNAKDAYTVIIQKPTKMGPHDEPVITGRFTIRDLGKIILSVDNPTIKRRKLIYRYTVLPSSEV